MRPHRHGLAVLLLALLACAAPAARAETEAPLAATPRVPRQNPMMIEIRAVLDAERASLAQLNQRFRAARDEAGASAIQKEIAQVKLDAEIDMLRVQIKYARAGGREAVAAFLEGAIRAMQSPPEHLPPVARPVPVLAPANSTTGTPR